MSLQLIGSLLGFGVIVTCVFYGSLLLEREAQKLKSHSEETLLSRHSGASR